MALTRPPVGRSKSTREFVDDLLGDLAAGGFSVHAWARFWRRSWDRSREVARERPRASADVHLIHLVLMLAGRPIWVATSWLMAWSHLGLLHEGADRGIGLPNLLSLARANLPAAGRFCGPWVALPALASDLLDGYLARSRGESTPFGYYCDVLADVAFWLWYVARYERSRRLRVAAVAFWLAPTAGATIAYLVRGRSIDLPRPLPARYLSAAFQVLLAARAVFTK